jgi:Flp pilus assembly protein TadG
MAVIEMCVAMLVLFYLVMGGVEFGWYMFAKHTVQAAARDGARAGIINSTTYAGATAAVTQTMTAAGFGTITYTTTFQRVTGTSTGVLGYTTTTNLSTINSGEGVRCTVTANFSNFRVRPLGVIPANKAVTGVSTMIRE